jgi:hypothetical protein
VHTRCKVPYTLCRRCFGKNPRHSTQRIRQDLGLDCSMVSLQQTCGDMLSSMARLGLVRRVPQSGQRGWVGFLRQVGLSLLVEWPLQKCAIVAVAMAVAVAAAALTAR